MKKLLLIATFVVMEILLVDGGEPTTWGKWQECSETCGEGYQERTQRCNSVSQKLIGYPCNDGTKETRTCNARPCVDTKDFIIIPRNSKILSLKYSNGKLICLAEPSILTNGSIDWYRDNLEITDSKLFINPTTLSLADVAKDDDAHEYTCKLYYNTSTVFSDTMVIKRNKHVGAVMKKHGSEAVGLEYTGNILACVVKETTISHNITWYRDSEEIKEKTLYVNESTLNLEKGSDNREHDYSCEVTNKDGSLFSRHLVIKGKAYIGLDVPKTSQQTGVVKLNQNETSTFQASCVVTSYPPAELHFLKNKEIITPDNRRLIKMTILQGKEVYELTINNITQQDMGEYHCLASNDYISKMIPVNAIIGDEKCSSEEHWKCPTSTRCLPKSSCANFKECILYNCELPSEPKDVKAIKVTYNSATLTWQKDPRAIDYTIIADSDNALSQTFKTSRNNIELGELKNNTKYAITMYASNKRGMSGEVHYGFKTIRMVPPEAIRNPVFVREQLGRNNLSTLFTWDVPEDDGMNNNGERLQYIMKYCLYDNHSETQCKSAHTNSTTMDLTHVNQDSLYFVSVTAFNEAGQAGEVSSMFYRTPKTSKAISINVQITSSRLTRGLWVLAYSILIILV